MTRKNNADYWKAQRGREWRGIAFAVLFLAVTLGMVWLL